MTEVAGLIMAGGMSRRMGGGDKSLRLLGGRPILDHVLERARPQVGPLLLNANGDPSRFSQYGLPVRADVVEGFAGPLAGILTGCTLLTTGFGRENVGGLRGRQRRAGLRPFARSFSPGIRPLVHQFA